MLAILHLLAMFVVDLFKSRRRREADNLFLRHQLNMHESAIGPKQTWRKTQSMSLLGVKRTCLSAAQVSAFDPKRTSRVQCGMSATGLLSLETFWHWPISILILRRLGGRVLVILVNQRFLVNDFAFGIGHHEPCTGRQSSVFRQFACN